MPITAADGPVVTAALVDEAEVAKDEDIGLPPSAAKQR
ncbi:hypothetical protein APY04_0563 [Hyphomicrobium sulfonivorans]|uniref:Uncharacterized protein n=1 Tax=Hyphomicrobium sulfonivorans TaxID=121290 RepID=A0A109BLB7_HYPSL|nr:hypothetical protein APY04_0563 [Hyphomicrobium sulfonivorans]